MIVPPAIGGLSLGGGIANSSHNLLTYQRFPAIIRLHGIVKLSFPQGHQLFRYLKEQISHMGSFECVGEYRNTAELLESGAHLCAQQHYSTSQHNLVACTTHNPHNPY